MPSSFQAMTAASVVSSCICHSRRVYCENPSSRRVRSPEPAGPDCPVTIIEP